MKTKSQERIEKMRKGECIKCPKCEDGFVSATGNPKNTRVFKCSHCALKMILTVGIRVPD